MDFLFFFDFVALGKSEKFQKLGKFGKNRKSGKAAVGTAKGGKQQGLPIHIKGNKQKINKFYI